MPDVNLGSLLAAALVRATLVPPAPRAQEASAYHRIRSMRSAAAAKVLERFSIGRISSAAARTI